MGYLQLVFGITLLDIKSKEKLYLTESSVKIVNINYRAAITVHLFVLQERVEFEINRTIQHAQY